MASILLEGEIETISIEAVTRRANWLIPAVVLLTTVAVVLIWASASHPASKATALPSGFQESVVFSGLTNPSNVRFAPDGRVFVSSEERPAQGVRQPVRSDRRRSSPTCARRRGRLLGSWRCSVLRSIQTSLPVRRVCPVHVRRPRRRHRALLERRLSHATGPDHGRLLRSSADSSRLTLSGNTMTSQAGPDRGQRRQQYPSHSIGDLNFGADGALYVSAGDGASFNVLRLRAGRRRRREPDAEEPVRRSSWGLRRGRCRRPQPKAALCAARACAGSSGQPVLLERRDPSCRPVDRPRALPTTH